MVISSCNLYIELRNRYTQNQAINKQLRGCILMQEEISIKFIAIKVRSLTIIT